jgi:hypothetical protein
MKITIIVILILVGLLIPGQGQTLDLTVRGRWNFFSDNSLEQGKGIEGKVGHKWVFLWGSYDTTQMRLYGQRAGDIGLYGVGGGVRIKLVDGLFINGELGYFSPSSTMADDPGKFNETLGFVIGGYIDDIDYSPSSKSWYSTYDYQLKGNIGGSVGLDFVHKIYKKLFFNFNGDYRFLKLPETFKGIGSEESWIEFKGHRNFSGGIIGIGLKYDF